MLSKSMAKMLNDQINMELYSGYLYLEMANYYEEKGLNGFGHWLFVQMQEEFSHAMRIRTYLFRNGVKVDLAPLKDPTVKYSSNIAPLETALKHEIAITKSINKIYAAATDEKDYRTTEFLNWFIEEQAEEEESFTILVEKMKMFGETHLYELNQEMAARQG